MDSKPPQMMKKRREDRLQSNYSRCLLTRKCVLPIANIGKNLDDVIEEYIRNTIEGRCVVEGFVRPSSCKIIRYSSGVIERGSSVSFEVVFECDVCFPVEGMILSCVVKNIVKAGIRAESSSDVPSPFVAFIATDHLSGSQNFNHLQVGDTILVSVIGQRFELNDKMISILGKLYKEKEFGKQRQLRPRLVLNN